MIPEGTTADEAAVLSLVRILTLEKLGVPASSATIGAISRHYFSILFALEVDGFGKLMVKIPKADLRGRANTILPLSSQDRTMGRAEFESLTSLASSWRGEDVCVRWVRPVAYIEDFNAVVTQRVEADDVTDSYRRTVLKSWIGMGSADEKLAAALSRIAIALSRFHAAHNEASVIDGAIISRKLNGYLARLEPTNRRCPPEIAAARIAVARCATKRWESVETLTLKGIDIRNVLQSREDETIWLLDPGKAKRAPREADLARFLLTWRILFWGTPLFALQIAPKAEMEGLFLTTYFGANRGDPALLNVFLMKELLKHWLMARQSLSLRPWSGPKKRLVSNFYIDPFFRRALNGIVETMH